MEFLMQEFARIEPYIATYGVAVIFIVIYLESFGAPLPGETGVIAMALLAARGDFHVASVFAAVFAGAVLGDSTGYLIGKFGGRRLLQRYGPLIKLTPERLLALEDQFRRKGVPLVLVARFLPVLRQLNGLIGGSLAMPWHIFLAANAAGALLWTALWVLGPYFFGEAFRGLR